MGAPAALSVAIVIALSGCLDSADSVVPDLVSGPSGAGRNTVVAIIDSGVNPYHEAFRGTVPSDIVQARSIRLTTNGTYAERVNADEAIWNSIADAELVHFEGTRLLAISLTDATPTRVMDDNGHGTRVASIAAVTDPDAVILIIEAHTVMCLDECYYHPSVPRAMEWAASQDWIDVISISAGEPVGKPHIAAAEPEVAEFAAASRLAAQNGKLVVTSAGNVPAPTLGGGFNGPPWVICVGGAEAANRGESSTAAKRVDVVSNMTMLSADFQDAETWSYGGGTSFATPIVASTIGRAIFEARLTLGDRDGISAGKLATGRDASDQAIELAADDFRGALNTTARRWQVTDWDATASPSGDPIRTLLYPTLPILAGPAQLGWGYVDASLAEQIAAVALGEEPAPDPGPEYTFYMARYQETREAAWS